MTIDTRTYTTHEVAHICNVYPTTVIGWIKKNKLRAFATPGGHRRVLRSDLVNFLKQFGFPVPEELGARRKRVLVVEDEESVGRLLCKALRRQSDDVQVDWTRDGIGALLALGKNPPDLLILDVVIPVVDGPGVLASLRADPQTRKIKVIGITGKRLPPDKTAFVKRHVDCFFFKPFDMAKFAEKAMGLLGIASAARSEGASARQTGLSVPAAR